MKEIGRITKIVKEGIAKVEFKSSSACAKCGKCTMGATGEILIKAQNKVGAKVGDQVEVEILSGALISSSFLIYILPIIFLVLGYFVGFSLHPLILSGVSQESSGIIFSIVFLFVSFVLLKLYDTYVSKKGKTCAVILRKVGGK